MNVTHTVYADVILPLALPQLYTYAVPQHLCDSLSVGMRVIVPLGQKKIYAGLVETIHRSPNHTIEIKEIIDCIDDAPIVSAVQIEFWKWMAEYYMCSLGEVMKAALPAGLKLESETHVFLQTEHPNYSDFTPDEEMLVRILATKPSLTIHQAGKMLKRKSILPVVASLIAQGVVCADEQIGNYYKPKRETYYSFAGNCESEQWLAAAFEMLKHAPKQKALLENLLAQFLEIIEKGIAGEFRKKDIVQKFGVSSQILSQLVQKNILHEFTKEVSRIDASPQVLLEKTVLSAAQKQACADIEKGFANAQVCLLHGVTASGKTEIYISLIHTALQQGKQVLYLVPEIALTTQITQKLQAHFGDTVGVFHSRMSDNERAEIWNRMQRQDEQQCNIILGVRSSVFLPFSSLGLVIVDEEHEPSYKQQDPAPRYHARDSAIVLARMTKASVVLGSATPSVESYYNVLAKKYCLVDLPVRYGNFSTPDISIIDLQKAYKRKQMKQHFSKDLLTEIYTTLSQNQTVLLLQNRRGYSPFIECAACGHVPYCKHCDVSLTFHKTKQALVCHYCGYTQKLGNSCSACGSKQVQTKGFGTEKIEDEIQAFFPQYRVARMDADTTRGKNGFAQIISQLEQKKIDILVGTQMITKGLDFSSVGLVGVIHADNLLNMPDYRAFEQGFHKLLQVAGRAGRGDFAGKVYIQTYTPEHPIITYVKEQNYSGFLHNQLQERQEFVYPPFVRLIRVVLKYYSADVCNAAAEYLKQLLPPEQFVAVLGPESPVIQKVQKRFAMHLLLKISRTVPYITTREVISNALRELKNHPDFKNVYVYCEVDV